ncbi:WSD1 family O-acyltransferase [Microbacterium sp. LWH7-1.2]|uniref:WS/DGAT domain-containing protein n=1 Tax=Microbacterium sp. LWH7-1.2 TaxID=3135257 RepID=UPI003139FF5C
MNDALLAAAASAYRAALISAGEEVPPELPVSVPVALPRRNEANAVGVMLVRLPLRAPVDDRLERIAAQTRIAKVAARAQGTLELMRGPMGAHLMNRLARRQHLVGGFITNVPGPREQLALAGAPMTHLWPVAVLAANVRMGVAAVSYAGRLSCGIQVDSEFIDGAAVAEAFGRDLALLSR